MWWISGWMPARPFSVEGRSSLRPHDNVFDITWQIVFAKYTRVIWCHLHHPISQPTHHPIPSFPYFLYYIWVYLWVIWCAPSERLMRHVKLLPFIHGSRCAMEHSVAAKKYWVDIYNALCIGCGSAWLYILSQKKTEKFIWLVFNCVFEKMYK